ncbi:amino acid/polyamine/organocation transporter (APC superfamily) [Edaphobacter aggregans]|uniref:Amino acid/polyamine/organocation transporter (APC superfamily) n=2 Tax=Edaphobacter aggregans TaxID=570835 RepID=A0A3R9NVT0_9BACT|nr:amino acid/polyamine/organocation transporter (APC superfamily) [Edaphobacter aggregans]
MTNVTSLKNTTADPSAPARDQGQSVSTTPQFVQGMGLFSATAIVMGSMIGSGIFIVSADMSRGLGSPALLIAAWLVTALMTIIGALSYGELAAMMPKAGGQYVYLREALGPLWGFLYGWTLFLVIQTGTIAAVGVAFGKFLGVFFPSVSAQNWLWHIGHVPAWHVGPMVLGNMDIGLNTANLAAIIVVVLLTVLNTLGVKMGAAVQNVFTSAKVLALAAVVLVGVFAKNADAVAANFGAGWKNFWAGAGWHSVHAVQVGVGGPTAFVGVLTILAVVQVGSLFSSDAWNNVTFTAGEIRNPRRNLPLSLAIGTGVVLLLYVLCNFVYLSVLPMVGDPAATTIAGRGIQFAAEDRVATAVMESAFAGMGAKLMAAAILVSTFGCVNGMLLAGARVYYAMSRDGLFFKSVGRLSERSKTPVNSLWVQCVWTCLLCLSGSYGQLLDYVIFAVLVFYILTIMGLFVLRRTRPDAARPYKAFGYPVLPGLYIVMAAWICVVLLRYKPQYTWPGLIIVLLGVPVYLVWKRQGIAVAGKELDVEVTGT